MGAAEIRGVSDFARFEGIDLRYGAHVALAGLDLSISQGEIFVLLGASGSGKTTLLKIAGGFLTPSAGRVVLDNTDITALPPWRRPVNTMFQNYALFPHMRVAENIAFGLRRQGMRGRELVGRIDELLALIRLEGHGARRISELSGGQQQRVALARSLACRPKLLLLDEPLSALDRSLREETRADLLALLKSLDTTAIIVTHDQDEALAIADRIGVLREGRLEQTGTPADLYERPASRAIAAFLGAANLIPARHATTTADTLSITLPGGATATMLARPIAPAATLHLSLRPEALTATIGTGPNTIAGIVESTTYRGATRELRLRLSDGTPLRASLPPDAAIPPQGSTLRLAWNPSRAVLLDQ